MKTRKHMGLFCPKSGWRNTRKRTVGLMLASLLALQPTVFVYAEDAVGATTYTDGYRVHANIDGTRTVTFTEEVDIQDVASMDAEWNDIAAYSLEDEDMEVEEPASLPEVISTVEKQGGDTKVTVSCADLTISFVPEIKEDAAAALIKHELPVSSVSAEQEKEQNAVTVQEAATEAKETQQVETEAIEKPTGQTAVEETPTEKQETETTVQTEAESETETGAEQPVETESNTVQEDTGTPASDTEKQTEAETEAETGTEQQEDTSVEETESVEVQHTVPDSKLRYEKRENGIKEELIIYGYHGGHEISYDFDFGGLTPEQQGNAFVLKDTDGDVLAQISAPYLYDAAGQESRDIKVGLEPLSGGQWRVTYIPSDAWLSEESRTWPVVLDPTLEINQNELVEDNYTDNGSGTHHDHNGNSLYAGNKGGTDHTAYIRPAFTDKFKKIASSVVIQDATVYLHVKNQGGSGTYHFYQIQGEWSSSKITGKNAPKLSASPFYSGALKKGGNTVDIKPLVSTWFNCLNQKTNWGFAITGDGKKNHYVELASADQHGANDKIQLTFSIKYEQVSGKEAEAGFTAAAGGNEANSGTGYVDLSWKKIPAAEGYYIGIFNGEEYEYFFVGNVTSWSTRGKGIWPTQSEINSGRYQLHWDGAGSDLPCIPAFTYANVAGGSYGQSLNYYFRLVPANEFGQAVAPATYKAKTAILPDRICPNQATEVSVWPDSWSNAEKRTVSWTGIQDYSDQSAGITGNLGTGCVQICVDSPDTESAWTDTGLNTASGNYTFPVDGLADGTHTVYVRGKDGQGNTGLAKGTYFYVDRNGPEGHRISVDPSGWTNSMDADLSWSGMQDVTAIERIELSIDGGTWQDTGKTEGSWTGYTLDTGNLEDGSHTISMRGKDTTGNYGPEAETALYIDRTAPQAGSVSLDNIGWSAEDTGILSWKGASDATSGIAKICYAIDGEWLDTEEKDTDGSIRLDLSNLEDGEHTVSFAAEDQAGNRSEEQTLVWKRDTTKPEAVILSPSDKALADGEIEIRGSITEKHLKEWKLTAAGEDGSEQLLASGTEELQAGQLGILDLSGYEDGEHVTITLMAEDEAGNQTEDKRVLIRVGGSMSAFTPTINIEIPELSETAQTAGSYAYTDSGQEEASWIYLDGKLAEECSGGAFLLDSVCWPEGSTHTVSIVSRGADGAARYSSGLGSQMLMEELWEKGRPAESGDSWISEVYTAAKDMMGLRLDVTGYTPGESSITYEYSTDGGNSWKEIQPDVDAAFGKPQVQVQIRVQFHNDGENRPELYRMSIAGVIEMNPKTVTARLIKNAEDFRITGPGKAEHALEKIQSTLENADAGNADWFLEGRQNWTVSDGHADIRYIQEGRKGSLSGLLVSDGRIMASRASTEELFREELDGVSEAVHKEIMADKPIAAFRFLAASRDLYGNAGKASYFYSVDGGADWQEIAAGEITVLPETSSRLMIKGEAANGCTLSGWELTAYYVGAFQTEADLVKEPVRVTAKDYGDTGEKKYELSWKDGGKGDSTASHRQTFQIYRDGKKIAETAGTSWTDTDYHKGAVYEVSTVMDYTVSSIAPYARRESEKVKAEAFTVKPDTKEGAKIDLKDYQQDEQLSSLYGGNTTFRTDQEPPSDDRALDQALLGRNKVCALGFEPVNFNTGNYILEASDWQRTQGETVLADILRTYNSMSDTTDGPFGAGWSTEYTQFLTLYSDGTVGYRKWDGALVLFRWSEEQNGYVCSTADHLVFQKEENGFTVTTAEGTVYTFGHFGLLDRIEKQGRSTTLERDNRGVLVKLRISDGTEITFDTDAQGHITGAALPGEASIVYTYDGNELTEVTDPLGHTVKYRYDSQGRMVSWMDASGTVQAENSYDSKGRVIFQKDALGGEYTIAYEKKHTIATDASGSQSEIWYDDQKRTVREKDAEGKEYCYTYDENGNMVSRTDGEGRLTSFAYDDKGNLTETVLADGSRMGRSYDSQGNLTEETDGNGHTTVYTYDTENRLMKTSYPDGGEEIRTYDQDGNLSTVTDGEGYTTAYTYDQNGNVLTETDPLGNVSSYAYDAAGNCISKTAPDGTVTSYVYDASGNQTAVRYPDGSEDISVYDERGNEISATDRNGNTITYTYDAMGRCIQTGYPDGTEELASFDGNGKLLSSTDRLGNTTVYTYDRNGNVLTETDPLGNVTAYTYDGSGQMTEKLLPTGAKEIYAYDAITGYMTGYTAASGETHSYEYDGEGNVTAEYLNGTLVEQTEYDSMGRVLAHSYADGSRESYAYDLAGNVIFTEDVSGISYYYTYDGNGHMLSKSDAEDHTVTFAYNQNGSLETVTDELGGVIRYTYDSMGNCVSQTDQNGNTTVYAYDGNGNLTEEQKPSGTVTSSTYDQDDNLTEQLLPDGNRKTYTYDAAGHTLTETDSLGNTVSYTYDAAGNCTGITDALGQSMQITYDALGNKTSETVPSGTDTWIYNEAGQLVEERKASGSVTHYSYDSYGRIAASESDGSILSYSYDLPGNVSDVTDGDGNTVHYTYDPAGRLLETLYADGTKDIYSYDELGQLQEKTAYDGLVTDYLYDKAGRCVAELSQESSIYYEYDAAGQVTAREENGARTEYSLNEDGLIVGATDEAGNPYQYAYDQNGRMTNASGPDGESSSFQYNETGRLSGEERNGVWYEYGYDEAGRMTSITDALGNTTTYGYDSEDQVIRAVDAAGRGRTYTYDSYGNLTIAEEGNSTIQYESAPDGRLLKETAPDGTETGYSYDAYGNLLSISHNGNTDASFTRDENGSLLSGENRSGKMEYHSDAYGNFAEMVYPDGSTMKYEYAEDGTLSAVTYPDGKQISYTYDSCGRLLSVMDGDEKTGSYEYDISGNVTAYDTADTHTEYTYDGDGRILTSVTTGGADLKLSYTYDAAGRMTKEVRTEAGKTVSQSYVYDEAGKLTGWSRSDGLEESYAYDSVGNMISLIKKDASGFTAVTMAYGEENQLSSYSGAAGTVQYEYDQNGRLAAKTLGDKKELYTYNPDGLLETYHGYDGYEVSYTYTVDRVLWEKKEHGSRSRLTLEALAEGKTKENAEKEEEGEEHTTRYIYDLTCVYPQLASETTDGEITDYIYGLNSHLYAENQNGEREIWLYDGRGSIIKSLYGENTGSYSYTPYGSLTDESMAGQERLAKGTFLGYNGEDYHTASGMVYLRARYYEPAMMRFSQKDSAPAEQYGPLSLNRYLYVEDDPVNYHDPDGEFLKRTYGGGSGRNFGTKSYASGQKSGTAGTAKKTSGQTTVRSRTSSTVTAPVKKTAAAFGKTVKSGNTGKNTVGNRKKTATAVSGKNKVTVVNYKERNGTGQYVNIPSRAPYRYQPTLELSTSPAKNNKMMSDTARSNQNTSRKNGKSSRYNNTVRTPFLSPTHQYMTNKVAEKQAVKSRQVNSCRAIQKPKATKTKTYSYKNFWNRKDGFFDGNWWQNPDKMDEAYRMLQEEIKARGKLNLVDLNAEKEYRKLSLIHELVNANPINESEGRNYFDNDLLSAMENAYVAVGIDKPGNEIDSDSIKQLKIRYDKNSNKKGNHLMQNGGKYIADGILIIAIGAVESWAEKAMNNAVKIKGNASGNSDKLIVRNSKFLDADGEIDWKKWAPNDGRVPGTVKEKQIIQKGTIIDRYGSQYGKYVSPVGVPYEQRALPYIENPNAYHKYKVLKPIKNVVISKIAPAFEQIGGGLQYELPYNIKKLEELHYIKEIK